MSKSPPREIRRRYAAIKRSQTHCHLCGELVDKTLRWPHLMSASIDHVMPRHHGGTDDPSNLRLAHLKCNSEKRDTIVAPRHSRRWL